MNKVSEYMSHTLYTTSPDRFAYEAIDEMYKNKISCLLVKDGENYKGIITKTDWMILVLKGECDPKLVKVSELMTNIAHTIDKDQTITEACAIIDKNSIRHLPVTENGKIVGMFSVKDLERYFLTLHKKTDF